MVVSSDTAISSELSCILAVMVEWSRQCVEEQIDKERYACCALRFRDEEKVRPEETSYDTHCILLRGTIVTPNARLIHLSPPVTKRSRSEFKLLLCVIQSGTPAKQYVGESDLEPGG
jgi:hypothetical protein